MMMMGYGGWRWKRNSAFPTTSIQFWLSASMSAKNKVLRYSRLSLVLCFTFLS